jgi:8-oxo-dGTP pyrophosphatase MutT (NUDIX family)
MKLFLTEKQISLLIDQLILEEERGFRELSEEEEDNAFAAFVVVKLPNNKIAATTRPYEKSKDKKIGLPGGKVESGENPIDAAYREAKEEGWNVSNITKIIASKKVGGNSIVYFEGESAEMLKDYVEKENDIIPFEATIDEISSTGYGNDFIKQYFGNVEEIDEQEAASTGTSTSSTQGTAQGYPEVGHWESGVTRGPANQIGLTKWSDIVGQSLKRGKANPLK